MEPVLEDGTFSADFVAQEAEMLRRRIEATINNRPQYAVNRLREEMCKDEPFGLHKYGDLGALKQVTPRLFSTITSTCWRRALSTCLSSVRWTWTK